MFLSFCGKTPRDEGAAFVAPSATVQGDVVLKPGSTVWYGAVLRGDDGTLTIGKNSNVQDNAVLHCDIGGCVTLGENVTVGHCALVHGCTVGDGSLIGMHATLLNHCVVGKNCIIGAGALVPEGMVIPDNSVAVGVPARVIKQVSAAQVEANLHNAAHYVEHGKLHAEQMKKRVRASSNVSFCIFFRSAVQSFKNFLIFHRNVMTFFVKSGILYLAGTVGPQPLPRT